MKNVYFLSDAHLGSRAIEHGRTQERRLVNFLDSIKHKAAAVYLLGDMFDFWYEFRTVVPKGYTRFLGKLSELTDMGVEVHFFTGNSPETDAPCVVKLFTALRCAAIFSSSSEAISEKTSSFPSSIYPLPFPHAICHASF